MCIRDIDRGHQLSNLATALTMAAEFGSDDWLERKVRDWLLLLLRFAVTQEPSDQSAVLVMALELDSLGVHRRPAAPRFFQRISDDVCRAIVAAGDGRSDPVLRWYIARIDNPRLRRAFQAAVGLRSIAEQRQQGAQRPGRVDRDLWKGLPKR
jgi:hypothetical protein